MTQRPHINADGEFQSDKYPTCPAGKVPLSVKDPAAQPLLYEYAQRRRVVDAEFAADLEHALEKAGYTHKAVGDKGAREEAWLVFAKANQYDASNEFGTVDREVKGAFEAGWTSLGWVVGAWRDLAFASLDAYEQWLRTQPLEPPYQAAAKHVLSSVMSRIRSLGISARATPFDGYNPRIPRACRGCGLPLRLENLFTDDGCPCNSPQGVNFAPKSCAICETEHCTRPGHRLQELFGSIGETVEALKSDAWKDADDKPLPEDAEIEEVFPTRSERHDLYAEAARMVGARFSKYGLVGLVNMLLHRIDRLQTAGKEVVRAWGAAPEEGKASDHPVEQAVCALEEVVLGVRPS